MTLNKFGDGTGGTNGPGIASSPMNANFAKVLRQTGQVEIAQLQDRAVTTSADGGQFVEAYTDVTGQNNTIDDTGTSAPIGSGTAQAGSDSTNGGTEANDGYTNPDNAFDNDKGTIATFSDTSGGVSNITKSLGQTFGATSITGVTYSARVSMNVGGSGTRTIQISIETYDGATWSTEVYIYNQTVAGAVTFDTAYLEGTYALGSSVQGVRLKTRTDGDDVGDDHYHFIKILNYGEAEATQVIHTIPTGTFSTTLSHAFCTFKTEGWESGADVQFKLTNATEDTGWLSTNELASFTTLTAEPDDLVVKMIPKTTSPTMIYPSINGVAVYGDKPA
jgi:hypothetical protein